MGVCVAVLLFLVLLHDPAAFTRAQAVYKITEGADFRVKCNFGFFGRKTFCKNNCNKEDILVETSEKGGACEGRFCIKCNFPFKPWYVSITGVTSADSGQYQCGSVNGSGMKQIFTLEVTKKIPYPMPSPGADLTAHDLNTANSSDAKFLLLLLILIPVVLIIALVLIVYKKRKLQNNYGNKRHSEFVQYKNCPAPPSEPADSIYQNLSPDTRDHTHIYSTLNPQPPPGSNSAPC